MNKNDAKDAAIFMHAGKHYKGLRKQRETKLQRCAHSSLYFDPNALLI